MISTPRIGHGSAPRARSPIVFSGQGVEVQFSSSNISQPTDWQIQDRNRETIVVHLGGEMEVLETELEGSGGSSGPANVGEVWTIPRGKLYRSHAAGATISYASISISSDTESRLLPVAGDRDSNLLDTLRSLQKRSNSRPRQTVHQLSGSDTKSLFQNVRRYLSSISKPSAATITLSNRQSRLAREHIFENLSQSLKLADLSTLLDMTPHHLLIAFRRAFSSTPGQYIIAQRIRHAQRRLRCSSDEITRIALDCGFSSHSHLTSVFTRRVGCAPSKYRELFVQ
jgi:AraC family transcriptional regulator